MVGKKGLFELKKCTVSGLERQFDKWHLFSAPTGGGGVGSSFRALLPSTWRTLFPDALFTRIRDTRKHPESARFSCFPC